MPGTGGRLLEMNFLKRRFAVEPLKIKTYLNLNDPSDPQHASIELNIDEYPTSTGNVTSNRILASPHLSPTPYQFNFNTIKAPGLYHDDGGLSNAPASSLNFRSIEMGREDRHSQIAMPWDADQMFFRRQQSHAQDNYFTPWMEVVHSGNIHTFTQPISDATQLALDTKQIDFF